MKSYTDQEIRTALLKNLQNYIEVILRFLHYLSKISVKFCPNQGLLVSGKLKSFYQFPVLHYIVHSYEFFSILMQLILLHQIIVKFAKCNWQLSHYVSG